MRNALRSGSGAAFHIIDRRLQTAAVREDSEGVGFFEDQGSLAVISGEFQDRTQRQVLMGRHPDLRVALEHSAAAIAFWMMPMNSYAHDERRGVANCTYKASLALAAGSC